MYTDAIQIGPSALSSEVVNLNQIRGSYICIYKLAEMVRLLLRTCNQASGEKCKCSSMIN